MRSKRNGVAIDAHEARAFRDLDAEFRILDRRAEERHILLAPTPKQELRRRIRKLRIEVEWADVMRDLHRLHKTLVQAQRIRFATRTQVALSEQSRQRRVGHWRAHP